MARFPSSLRAARLAAVPVGVPFFLTGTHRKNYKKTIVYNKKLLEKTHQKRDNNKAARVAPES